MWKIEFYITENGRVPVDAFIESTTPKMKARILREIDLLAELGISLRLPHTKALGNGLFELRITCSGDISRIIYFHFTDKTFVLLNGFIKKTTKSPSLEIETAKSYMKDYRRRNG